MIFKRTVFFCDIEIILISDSNFVFKICVSGFIYGVEDHICEYYGYWTKQEIPFGENPFLNKFLSKNAISKYVVGSLEHKFLGSVKDS